MPLNAPIPLGGLDVDLIARLGFAAFIGMLLGLDRELRGHAAGMRTHGLVCLSAAAMAISIIALYLNLDGARMDPLRLYEASGAFVGIIGAGLIVFSRGKVHNLTTAANLWLAAVVGMACGAGQWPLVLVASVISAVMLTALRLIERKRQDRTLGESDASDN